MTSPSPGTVEGPGPKALDAAVLRIRDAAGTAVGLGFLVTDELALTCAHVVSTTLGTPLETRPGSHVGLDVDLPLLPASAGRSAGTGATVERWFPDEDVAVLRLNAPLPGARPLRLTEAHDVWGHPARAFGFPVGRPGGVWHSGELRDRQANGLTQLDLAAEGGYRVSGGFSGTPVWDGRLAAVVGMMALAESADPPVSYLIPTQRLLETWPELRGLALPPSPFRSLTPFRETDAPVFHGRRKEADELGSLVAREQWATVVGPSGCGKSSLAMAGVVPRFRAQGGCAVVFRPSGGSSPLSALAAALLPLLEPGRSEIERLSLIPELARLLARDQGMADVVPQVLERQGSSGLLIVVDQFEELLARSPAAVDELVGALFGGSGSRTPLPAVRILTTLRADFLESALADPRLRPVFDGQRTYALGPMGPEQLREIITAPVDAIPGVSYEPRLVERILADAGTEPGALPLLGFTLEQLWQQQRGGLLTLGAYEELGGVSGALSAYAERAWEENVPARDEATARRLFTQLVRVPLGSAGATRRLTPRTELGAEEWRIAQQLATTRLLVTGRDAEKAETVELAHEALIGGWARLARWTADDRAFLEWRESLRHDRQRWEEAGRVPELLPTTVTLANAQRWLGERDSYLTEAEHDYLRRGRAHRRSRTRRRRAAVAVVCVLALVAATIGAISMRLHAEAAQKAAVVRSTDLAADAQALSTTDPGLAGQLAIAAYRSAPTQEAATGLYTVLGTPLDSVVGDTGHKVLRTAAQPDGPLAAAVDTDGSVRIWDLTHPLVPVLDAVIHPGAAAIALAPRGRLLAAACSTADGLCLWSLADPRHPGVAARLPRPGGGLRISSMAISPDGTLLAAASMSGSTLLWSIAHPTQPRLLAELPNPTRRPSGGGPLAAVAFSPRGNLLATTILGGATRLWNLSGPSAPVKAATIATGYAAAAFSPDGSLLAAVGDNAIGLWNVTAPAAPRSIKVAPGEAAMMTVAFGPDGHHLAIGGKDNNDSNGELCLLDLVPDGRGGTSPRQKSPYDTSVSPTCTPLGFDIVSLTYTPGGALLSGGSDGTVRSWRSALPRLDAETELFDYSTYFSPGGHLMAAEVPPSTPSSGASPPSVLGLWDVSAPGAPVRDATVRLPGPLQEVQFLTDTALLTALQDGTVWLWDVRDPRHPRQAASLGTADFYASGAGVPGPGVTTDTAGDLAAVQGGDGLLHLWRVSGAHGAAEVGSFPVPAKGLSGLLSDGRTAFVATAAGIDWWNTSDPRHPVHGDHTRLADAKQRGLFSYGSVFAVLPATQSVADEDLRLLDVVSGRVRSPSPLHGVGPSSSLVMSDDGRLLAATGTGNNTVTLWDVSDPLHPRTTATFGSLDKIQGLRFDPGGRLLAVWNESAVQLWNLSSPGAPVLQASITAPNLLTVGALAVFPGTGGTLALGGDPVFLYDTDPARLADRLCSYTGGSITAAQWRKYAPGTTYRNPCG